MANRRNKVDVVCKLLGIARRTYFHWKKSEDKSKLILLIEKYFKSEEIEEFMISGEIKRQELIVDLDRLNELLIIERKYKKLENIFNHKDKQE